jgi:hypothetical protein
LTFTFAAPKRWFLPGEVLEVTDQPEIDGVYVVLGAQWKGGAVEVRVIALPVRCPVPNDP